MTKRRLLSIAVALIALNGCSAAGGLTGGPSTSGAAGTAGQSSASSPSDFAWPVETTPPAGSTVAIKVQPWSHELVESARPTVAPDPSKPNYCEPSLISDRPDAYRCYRSNSRYNFCIVSSASAVDFACLDEKLDWYILQSVDHTTRSTGTKPEGWPGQFVYFKLTDGTICSRFSGAGPTALGDYTSPGDCSDHTSLWTRFDPNIVPIDPASPFGEGTDAHGAWLVKTGPAAGPLKTRTVEAAYR